MQIVDAEFEDMNSDGGGFSSHVNKINQKINLEEGKYEDDDEIDF